MVRNREHDDLADRKYLLRRGGVWYVRFRLPERLGGGIFLRSLGTGDVTTARRWRDMYVAPFVAGENLFDATQALLDRALQQGLAQDKRFEQLNRAFVPGEVGGESEMTLQVLVDKYLAHVKKGEITASTRQAYSSILTGFIHIVGPDRPAKSITKQDVSAYKDRLLVLPINWLRLKEVPPKSQIKKTVSPAQVANSLSYIRGLFSWAINEEVVDISVNPAQGVKAPFASNKKRRPFTKAEVEQACKVPFPKRHTSFDEEAWKSLPLLARYTGARLGELAQLTGKDIVEVHGTPCLRIYEQITEGRTTKTHIDREVPIARKIQPLVTSLRKNHGDGPLFPNCGTWTDKTDGPVKHAKQLGNVFGLSVKRIAPDVSFHSFRHYAISQMANAGIPEEVRERIVGHKTKTVHQGYTQIDIKTMVKAVDTGQSHSQFCRTRSK